MVRRMEKFYQWPLNYGEQIKFKSRFTFEESLKKLKYSTRRSFFIPLSISLFESRLIGRISEKHIVLARSSNFLFPNLYKPVFKGILSDQNGQVVLEGYFGVNIIQKIFFWICVIFSIVFFLSSLIALFVPDISIYGKIIFLLSPLLIIAAYLSPQAFHGKKNYKPKDIEWVSQRIVGVLNENNLR